MKIKSFEELYCFLDNFAKVAKSEDGKEIIVKTPNGEHAEIFSDGLAGYKIGIFNSDILVGFDEIAIQGVEELKKRVFFSLFKRGCYVAQVVLKQKRIKRS